MSKDILKQLGHKIKFERIKQDISQQELAEITGLSVQTISAIENGTRNTTFLNVCAIVKAFKITLVEFLDFKL